ncbi:hypothetical protein [Microbulbifer spongiae]|uniref:Uncharacterized protein n=1 Tax=Microbulbifer spongiae TaxID=2944933 RepID=A0ABY9EDM3_9GAMM|nr:hypothetical protein [Microbulbifer sp. MI-G]WKD50148.1 hypothetical protein M8T91_01590 [Microbulbifer sp. MI-G]
MKNEQVKEVLACLGDERRVFRYFKDRYCFDLIEFEMNRLRCKSMKVSDLKTGVLSQQLQKPVVAQALKHCANGVVSRQDLQSLWSKDLLPFSLSLTSWGDGDRGWDQTSRNQCNLVLQLNFDGKHNALYRKLVKPDAHCGPFECWGHPVQRVRRKTMSWVRMDIGFDTNEVLIEEIQNDWLRNASVTLARVKMRRVKKPSAKPGELFANILGNFEDLEQYVEQTLAPYRKLWAEASMLAALRFIRDELGISTVYYHCFETGKRLKAVCGSPPRSMYTQLPRKFGFEKTQKPPALLAGDKFARRCIKAIRRPHWYRLAI